MPRLPSKVTRLASAGLVLLAAALGTAAAPGAGQRPAGPGGDCLGCHAGLVAGRKVVHPPVQNGLCLGCHASLSPTEHLFGWQQEGKAMCRQCHAPRDTEKVRHNPVEQGLCLLDPAPELIITLLVRFAQYAAVVIECGSVARLEWHPAIAHLYCGSGIALAD